MSYLQDTQILSGFTLTSLQKGNIIRHLTSKLGKDNFKCCLSPNGTEMIVITISEDDEMYGEFDDTILKRLIGNQKYDEVFINVNHSIPYYMSINGLNVTEGMIELFR